MSDPVVAGVVFVLALAAVLTVCVSFYAGLRVGRDRGYIAGKRAGRRLERALATSVPLDEVLADELEAAEFPTTLGGDRA